jgi:hypothetical protein
MRYRTGGLRLSGGALVAMALAGVLSGTGYTHAQNSPPQLAEHTGFGERILLGSNSPLFDLSRSSSLFRGLSVSGFLQNISGMWVNSSALTNFGRAAGEHHGANSLAVERNLLQLDFNYFLNGGNRFFLRFWGTYEPPYPWEAHNIAGVNLMFDHSQSDFYNSYVVRDAYWKNTTGPLTLFLGRQIVTWGESIAFRVGDVVNPQRFDAYPYPFMVPAQTPPGAQAAYPQVKNFAAPFQSYRLPTDTWVNSTEGIRLHSLVLNAEITALYWHAHQLNPTDFVTGAAGSAQTLQFRYPDLNDIGLTMNRPIYLNGETFSGIPLVLRSEAIWQDRTPFNTINVSRPSGVIHSSTLNTLLALDVDNLAAPSLTDTGALTTNFEWNNYTIMSPNRDMVYGGYAQRWRHN